MTTFVPGGASGVALKSKLPYRYACADSFGLTREVRSRFKVSEHCGINRSHSDTGKLGSHVAKPARR